MKQQVADFIAAHHLLQPDRLVLVALSGGPDSVALLCLLHELGYPLLALHCNFHLRGEESDRDCAFVTRLCGRYDVVLQVKHFSTRQYAADNHFSLEMAARELRYQWFREMLQEHGAQAIAVGHHSDDQAETLLLNLLRGTGIRGLCGMHPRQGHVVRPLLCCSRQDILDYLKSKHEQYVTDSTNLEDDARRNFIRHHIMPKLSDLQPGAPQALAQCAAYIQDALPYYQRGVHQAMQDAGITENSLSLDAFRRMGSPSILLHEWLAPCGFHAAMLNDILKRIDSQPGTRWKTATHTLLMDRGRMLLFANEEETAEPHIHIQQVPSIGETGADIAYFDADLLSQPLHMRLVRNGDWFVPFGMKGRKLLSDFLTDCKMNLHDKTRQYVLCHGEDIIWVIGLRSDNRYRVTSRTQHILKMEVRNEK